MSTATNCVDGNHIGVTTVCPAADGLFYQSAGPGTLLGGACLFLENALMSQERSSEECLLLLLCFHVPCFQQLFLTEMSTATDCVDGHHVVVTAVCPAADGLFYQSAGPGTLLGGACLCLENA
jgi:hypothetical protein